MNMRAHTAIPPSILVFHVIMHGDDLKQTNKKINSYEACICKLHWSVLSY